jgi:hypothetical protein
MGNLFSNSSKKNPADTNNQNKKVEIPKKSNSNERQNDQPDFIGHMEFSNNRIEAPVQQENEISNEELERDGKKDKKHKKGKKGKRTKNNENKEETNPTNNSEEPSNLVNGEDLNKINSMNPGNSTDVDNFDEEIMRLESKNLSTLNEIPRNDQVFDFNNQPNDNSVVEELGYSPALVDTIQKPIETFPESTIDNSLANINKKSNLDEYAETDRVEIKRKNSFNLKKNKKFILSPRNSLVNIEWFD